MARRKKTSPLQDVLDLLAKLPWWVCLVLGAVSYIALHRLAAPITPHGMQERGGATVEAVLLKAIIQGLATAGQYIVPLLCLTAAAVSAWRRKQRRGLVRGVSESESAAALDGMTWKEFELLVGESYRQQGYRVVELGGAGPDGGVDLVLVKANEKFFVQCKQWKAHKVGVTTVRELYGVMAAKGATGGFVVTSGRFTADATEFAQGRNVGLVDGRQLIAMIRRVQAEPRTAMPAQHAGRFDAGPPAASAPAPHPQTGRAAATDRPDCPRCNGPMQLRTAQKGANAGSSFWGCSTYPRCRGTRATAQAGV